MLTSDYFPFSKTQCAVFKGTDRTVFLDKREYTGPIYKQIENAVEFVLRNIRLGATIDGLVRQEKYELPVEAIREMIINAHCHRNLLDESCIQVAIYDDRLEVTSPGGLYNGLTYEEVMKGHSKIRNKLIANAFGQMGLVEAWGSGIRRIIGAAREYGLLEPRVEAFDDMFRVNLYRKNEPQSEPQNEPQSEPQNEPQRFGDLEERLLNLIRQDGHVTRDEMASQMNVSLSTVKRSINKLKDNGLVEYEGSSKSGYWIIKQR